MSVDKELLTKVSNVAVLWRSKQRMSAQLMQAKLYTLMGRKLGIYWCEMIADAYGKHAIKKICERCRGDNLVWDASAQWDETTQRMEHCDTYDNVDCRDCDSEAHAIDTIIITGRATQ